MNTGKWATSFYGRLIGPTTARTATIGFSNAAGTHSVAVVTDFAQSTTNYLLKIIGAGGTTYGTPVASKAADTAFHWFTLSGDGTTFRLYIDGVLTDSTITLTNVANEPMEMFIANTIAADVKLSAAIYGYVLPT